MPHKTLCIDARLYGIQHTGIGRYVENLLANLPGSDELLITVIVAPENSKNPVLSRFKIIVARYHPYSLMAQFEMMFIWLRIRPDLLHVTHFSIPLLWPGKMVVTIHDLIKHLSRGKDTTTKSPLFYWPKYLGYLLISHMALLRAGHIIVPAIFWKNYLTTKLHIPGKKITVTYEGVHLDIKPGPVRFEVNLPPQPYIVYTGNLYPHKNIATLISAIKLLDNDIKLAIICARSVFSQRVKDIVKSAGLEDKVFFLGKLTDSQVAHVYSKAFVFVFPSLLEGFGLPGLEAMSLGLPVIAANASCLPEIYGDAAIYFSPKNAHDLKSKIEQVLTSSKLQSEMRKRGAACVKKYSWDKMSKQTWQIYLNELR